MPLHIVKLCVGIASPKALRDHVEATIAYHGRGADVPAVSIVTRMVPTRAPEIVGQGSIFWVFKGQIGARQAILSIEPFTDPAGIRRCRIGLDPSVVDVVPRPRRIFQGWRYLEHDDAPRDLSGAESSGLDAMPEGLRRELAGLGLV